MGIAQVLSTLWRYSACITFPTLAGVAIFADWNHTRKWKAQLKNKAENQLE